MSSSSAISMPETETFLLGECVAVLLPLPLSTPYDYRIDEDMRLCRGDFVAVTFGKQRVIGVVWGKSTQDLPASKIKPIQSRLTLPPMPQALRHLIDWVAAYTLTPAGLVLKMAMSVPSAFDDPKTQLAYRRAAILPERMTQTQARQKVLALLAEGQALTIRDLADNAKVGASVMKGLIEAGALIPVPLPMDQTYPQPDFNHPGPVLSAGQTQAAQILTDQVSARCFSVTLLEGVTGSGKTEVYFEAIAQSLRLGRQVLVLLPEIVLSSQWLARFKQRFGVLPAQWHSDLSDKQRRQTWRAVASGAASVVVGARSALFLPFPDLGLIVVDEEHDASFKQEEGVIYHGRDMAVVRGRFGHHPVILASATPSLETIANVKAGKYQRVHLPERHAGAILPTMDAIDLRKNPPPRGQWLSPPLVQAIEETLAAGEQAMLYLNRRGYAPLTLCRGCGFRLSCPHCTAWLVDHRGAQKLQCHHCGYRIARPDRCPECETENNFVACGPGVERLSEEVAHRFPECRFAVMASDTLGSTAAASDLVQSMARREIDLLIGTQIMAKGHHFPHLTLVGVVDADLGLSGGDLRASERTWQLLNQVAGRAGRAEHPGRVYLQTFQPDSAVIRALLSGDGERFMAEEAHSRYEAGMPPFGRLVALILSAPTPEQADQAAKILARAAPFGDHVTVLGPAPAPLAILRGRHRRRFLLKTAKGIVVQEVVKKWLGAIRLPSAVRLQIDVDPYSFF